MTTMPDPSPVIYRWRFGLRLVIVTADAHTPVARALAVRVEARSEQMTREAMAELRWLECFKQEFESIGGMTWLTTFAE